MSQEENVPTDPQEQFVQLVTFSINQQLFGLEVSHVQEVIQQDTITPTPGASQIIEGVIDLRDNIIPVVDLQKHLQMQNTAIPQERQVIITEVADYIFGFMVDKVHEVQTFAVEAFEPPPPGVSIPGHEYIVGIAHQDGGLLIFLDLAKVLDLEQWVETKR